MLCNKEGDSGRKSTQCKHGARTAAARRRASQAAPRQAAPAGFLQADFRRPQVWKDVKRRGETRSVPLTSAATGRRWSGTPDASRRFFRHWPGHGPIELGENLARRPDRSTAMEFAGTPPSSDCHNLMPGHFQWMTTAHGGRNMCVRAEHLNCATHKGGIRTAQEHSCRRGGHGGQSGCRTWIYGSGRRSLRVGPPRSSA